MADVSINLVYNEVKRLRKEVEEIRHVLIQEEQITEKERRELRTLFRQIERGKGTPWREVLKG